MGLVVLVLLLAGFIGTVLSFFNIVVHAYKEQGPLWGLLCVFVPCGNVAWGIVHWNDEAARALFVRYLACGGAVVLGMILNKALA